MTDFIVSPSLPVSFENLEWDLTPPNHRFVIPGTLAVAALTAAQHFPLGYVPSGMILSFATTGGNSGLLVPYLNAATAGTGDVASGVLVHSIPITRLQGGANRTKVGVALLVHGVVSQAKLPFTVGNAAAGGYLDAAGKTDLPLIYWAA